MQKTLIGRLEPVLVAQGLLSAEEIETHLADLDAGRLDIAVFPIVAAYGRKPRIGTE